MMHVEWSLHQSIKDTMVDSIVWVGVLLVLGLAWGNPLTYHDGGDELQRLGQRLASHAPALEARGQEPRLTLPGLPSPQELDAIKKVAQILIMLGEQVIPSIIGSLPPPEHGNNCDQGPPLEDIPNDPIKDN